MTARPTETPTGTTSRNCATGNHKRCLGTVHVPGVGRSKCACPVDECGHGTDTYKARRNRKR